MASSRNPSSKAFRSDKQATHQWTIQQQRQTCPQPRSS